MGVRITRGVIAHRGYLQGGNVPANTACNSRYFAFIKFHSRPGYNGQVIQIVNSNGYLVSFEDIEEAKKAVNSYLCTNGQGGVPFHAYIIDQKTNTVASHVGVDPQPVKDQDWKDSK